MIEFKRSKKRRSKKALFNPYQNGISSYDMTYLSSKRILKTNPDHIRGDFQNDYLAS